MRRALLGVLSLLAFPSFAGLDERIQVAIEEPVQGERYSGISNLRGWAVSPEGTGNFYHQVFIDGDFAFYMSPYGNRIDVGNTFPDYPDSDTAGFSMAFNYKDLAPGEHEIKVRAFDNASNYNEAVTTFTTERFDSTFIASDSDVDLSGLDNVFLYDDQALLLNGASVEGKRWNFLLKWDKPSQSFKIWGIEGYAGDLSYSTGYEVAGSDGSASAYAADCDPVVEFGCGDSSSTGSGSGSSGSSTADTDSGSGSTGSSTADTDSGSSSGSGTASTGSGSGSSGSGTASTGSGSSSSRDSSSDAADCDPALDFGCQDSSTQGGDSSDGTGTTDDCANVTGYNPNCSDSSGSGGSTSSSGSPSDSSGSGGSGSSSGSGGSGSSSGSSSDASGGGCYSSDNRCVQVYPSSVDLGNSAFSLSGEYPSSFQVTIEERTVAVVDLSIEPSFYQVGYIYFAIDVSEGTWFYTDELVVWISETPDGASVSDSCRYKGFFEGDISFRLDGSGSCSLSTGEYFVNFAVCSSDPDDWACSFDGAVMNSHDLKMRLRRRYL